MASTVPPEVRAPRTSLRQALVALARTPVDWACYQQDRSNGSPGRDFVRLVRLATVDADGREHEARLTPVEARDLAARLLVKADLLDAYNVKHGNGTIQEG